MHSHVKSLVALGAVLVSTLAASNASAQDVGGEAAPAAPAAPPVAQTPTQVTTTQTVPTIVRTTNTTNYPQVDPNAHLPPSSRPRMDINEGDTLSTPDSGPKVNVMRGAPGAPGVIATEVRGSSGVYVVQTGDTLSNISQQIYGQPWMWPKLWSLNPQIQNPHWIYPGDEIRLTGDAGTGSGDSRTLGAGMGKLRKQLVPKDGVFQRKLAYIDDPAKGIMGEVVGAVEPVQLMGQGQHPYVVLKPGEEVEVGQELTVFREVRDPPRVQGARRPPGKIVALEGTLRVEYVNLKTRVVRAVITESVHTIERGSKVGLLDHDYKLVEPRKAEKDVTARVLTSMYPHVIMGKDQVVFIDRGEVDGLKAGNRLFVTRRGDTWRRTLATTTTMASSRIEMYSDENLDVEAVPMHGNEQDFPEEVVAELRIVRADKQSSLALVTRSSVEIVPGDRAIARSGF